MALEWGALALLVAVEALLLIFVTLPGLQNFRRGVIHVANRSLQPLLAGVPFALFLLLDVYFKYENRMKCQGTACTPMDREHFAKSIMKSHRNAILALCALLLYWILFRVTALLVELERVSVQLRRSREE